MGADSGFPHHLQARLTWRFPLRTFPFMAREPEGLITEETLKTLFGRTLKSLRITAEKSQAMLEESSGVNQNQISAYETGKKIPRLPNQVALLRSLGVSLLDFVVVMEEQARRLDPRGDSGKWVGRSPTGEGPDEIAEGDADEAASHIYVVVAAPTGAVKSFAGGPPSKALEALFRIGG